MKKIIAFTGPAGAGKDECVKYLVGQHGFTRLAFAKGLKDMLAAIGISEPPTQAEKEEVIPALGRSYRYMAQTLGTEWGRKLIHDDLWVKIAEARMGAEFGAKGHAISDLRFENEATMVRHIGGVIVHLKGRKDAMADGTKAHASEAGIVYMDTDITVHNDVDNLGALHRKLDLALRHVL